jgi:hypothetical protein
MYACRRCDSDSRWGLRITRVESDIIFAGGVTLVIYRLSFYHHQDQFPNH